MEPNKSNNDFIYHSEEYFNYPGIIINADDLGICSERDEGIFELFQQKKITSSTILVNSINFQSSIKKSKELGLPLGLHLNLTEGIPVNNKNLKENSLVFFDESSKSYSMHGKNGFRQRLLSKSIKEDDIKNEIIEQILTFIEFYGNIPTHIDGHQHVHIIPNIAYILAPIMSISFGIYQIRLPSEDCIFIEKNVENLKSREFYITIIQQSEISKNIFKSYNICYPTHFAGMSIMGTKLNNENLESHFEKLKHRNDIIEIMCHPGNIPESYYWDEFNVSQDRVYEKNFLLNYQRFNNYNFCNFLDLPFKTTTNLFNILIIGDFTYGTGNSITAIRIQKILQSLNCNAFLYNSSYINKKFKDENCLKYLTKLIQKKKIHMIFGIHLWRSGRVINLLREKTLYRIPYILIASGTDANHFIHLEKESQEIKLAMRNCEKIISFNEEMIIAIQKIIPNFNYEIIPQSVGISEPSDFSLRKKLNIDKDKKLTLFPSGIRNIKDPKFVLKELLEILEEKKDHYIVLIGAKLDLNLLDEIINYIKFNSCEDISHRFIIHDVLSHQEFVNVLKESNLVINTSITEGMSNVLMESMYFGIPILARKNEGNLKLIEHNITGFIFSSPIEFKNLYDFIYNQENLHLKLNVIKNAMDKIKQNFSMESEKLKFNSLLVQIIKCNFNFFELNDFSSYLLFFKNVYPFRPLNNEIFSQVKFDTQIEKNLKEINILNAGCDSGILTIVFLLQHPNLLINELVLTDIEENCLFSCFSNFNYLKQKFHINRITFIQSYLFNKLDFKKYSNYFDVVLANMPQTPSISETRSN
jgi:predicted glycoside hydrolase/deacetylase ChbG (UPF0249 family)